MSNICFNPLAWAIKPLYDKAIAEDSDFAKEVKEKESRAEKPKSLSECAEYILGEAFEWASEHRNGMVGYSGLPDDEMINLIKHYYDEDDIVIKKVTEATASVATTAEEKDEPKKAEKPSKAKIVKIESAGLFAPQNKPDIAPAKKKEKAETLDLFAGLWGDDEPKKEKVKVVADDDDLPL